MSHTAEVNANDDVGAFHVAVRRCCWQIVGDLSALVIHLQHGGIRRAVSLQAQESVAEHNHMSHHHQILLVIALWPEAHTNAISYAGHEESKWRTAL